MDSAGAGTLISMLAEYEHLPLALWKTYEELGLHSSGPCIFTSGESTIVTNGTSRSPVIGTAGVEICIALILYDRVHGIAAIGHYENWSPQDVQNMVSLFPPNSVLEAHMGGGEHSDSVKDSCYASLSVQTILSVLKTNPRIRPQTANLYPRKRPVHMGY